MSSENTAEKIIEEPEAADTSAPLDSLSAEQCSEIPYLPPSPVNIRAAIAILFSVLFVATLLLPSLGLSKVFEVSEAREGEVVRAMAEQQNYVLPLRHYAIVPSKPPLYHWLSLGFVGPEISESSQEQSPPVYNEFWLRFPSALSALVMLAVTAAVAASISGAYTAIVVCFVLATTGGFVDLGTDGRVDMLFSTLIVGAVLVWLERILTVPIELQNRNSLNLRLVAALAGCSVLAKGPLGVVLIAIILTVTTLVVRGFRSLRLLFSWQWCWALAIPLPWYVLAQSTQVQNNLASSSSPTSLPSLSTSFFERSFIFENWKRLVGGEGITAKPWYFYFENFPTYTAPWGLILIALIVILALSVTSVQNVLLKDTWSRFSETEKKLFKASLTWIFVTILVLSLAAGKRTAYLAPLFPAISIAVGLLLSKIPRGGWFESKYQSIAVSRGSQISLLGVFIVTTIALLPFGCLALRSLSEEISASPWLYYRLQSTGEAFNNAAPFLIPATILLSLTSVVLLKLSLARSRISYLLASIFSLLLLVNYVTVRFFNQLTGEVKSYRTIASTIDEQISGEPLTSIKKPLDESLDGLFFYLRATSKLTDLSPAPVYPGLYLARRSWWDTQDETWKYGIHHIWEGGRPLDEPTDRLVLFRLGKPNIGKSKLDISGKKNEGGLSVSSSILQDSSQPIPYLDLPDNMSAIHSTEKDPKNESEALGAQKH